MVKVTVTFLGVTFVAQMNLYHISEFLTCTDPIYKSIKHTFEHIYSIFNCVRVHIIMHMPHLSRCLQSPEKNTESPGAGVSGSCELPKCECWESN